jgi:glycosyltransferase involved in cell wall biosynthesis
VSDIGGDHGLVERRAVRVLVVTVAHRGDDARIAFRQIGALSDAGLSVTYVAPVPVLDSVTVAERIVVSRALGVRRVRGWWQVMRAVRSCRDRIDVVLIHDLELVLPVRLARPNATIVWDVHEDLLASVGDRSWIPRLCRRPVQAITRALERFARRGTQLILAEHSYAARLGDWPVVPNSAVVPPSISEHELSSRRVVYLGRISLGRGVAAMIELARKLGDEADVVLIGPADDDVVEMLQTAADEGFLTWLGPLPNPEALEIVERSVVGLCLLEPLPTYLGSMPTKIHEYSARGIATVCTSLPLAAQAIEHAGAGAVVPFGDTDAAYAAVRAYLQDPATAREHGRRAHDWAFEHHNWTVDSRRFVQLMTSLGTPS